MCEVVLRILSVVVHIWYYALNLLVECECDCSSVWAHHMSIAHTSHEYLYKCTSNHACARTAQTDRCISEILQAHTLAHSHTHTPAHTLELWSRRVWGLTLFRPLSSLDLRYNKLTELPSFPGFSSLRSLVCMGDGVCVCERERSRERVCGPQAHTHSLSVGKDTCVSSLAWSRGLCALKCVLQCAHTHARTHTTSYAQHIMQRAFVYVSSFTNLRT